MNVFQRLLRAWGVVGLFTLMLTLSACNLNATPEVETEPLNTETPTPEPSATFTLTPLPVAPASATAVINSGPTLIPLTTQGTDNGNITPIGQRDDSVPTAAGNGSSGGNAQTVDDEDDGEATIPFPATFSDRYTARVGTGRTLLVNYLVELREAGTGQVFFLVNDPNGEEVARWVITESADETEEIPVEVGGEYEILVAFENLRGYYSVDFDTE